MFISLRLRADLATRWSLHFIISSLVHQPTNQLLGGQLENLTMSHTKHLNCKLFVKIILCVVNIFSSNWIFVQNLLLCKHDLYRPPYLVAITEHNLCDIVWCYVAFDINHSIKNLINQLRHNITKHNLLLWPFTDFVPQDKSDFSLA